MNPNTPLAVQQLLDVEYLTVTREIQCCSVVYGVSSRNHGNMFTIKQGWFDYFIRDMQDKTIGNIITRRRCMQPMVFQVQVAGMAPVHIRPKPSLMSRSILITDERDQQMLKLKIPSLLSHSYEILGTNDAVLGELKQTSGFGWEYNISCPRDLDVRYKMALISVPIYIETRERD